MVWLSARRPSPGEAVRVAIVGGGGAHLVTGMAIAAIAALLWAWAYNSLIGGLSIPLVSEFFWWDWLIDPAQNRRGPGYNSSYRSVGLIHFGRLEWPLGPAVGVGLLAAIVSGYARLSRLALKAAAVRLGRDWYAGP